MTEAQAAPLRPIGCFGSWQESQAGQREQRAGLRDDLELMFKAEIMGRLGGFETGFERRLGESEERIGALGSAQRQA